MRDTHEASAVSAGSGPDHAELVPDAPRSFGAGITRPFYTTDAEGRLTHFNQAAVEFSGRLPDLGTDRWCVSWRLYYPDGRPMPHDECPMAIALRENRPVRGADIIVERPDGTRIWCAPYPTPLRDAEGRANPW